MITDAPKQSPPEVGTLINYFMIFYSNQTITTATDLMNAIFLFSDG